MTHAEPSPCVPATPPGAPPARPRRSARELARSSAGLALGSAALSIAVFAFAAIGFRQGWIGFAAATRGLTGIAVPALALLAVLFGLLAALLALTAKPRGGAVAPLVAAVLGLGVFLFWTQANARNERAPPVHDVATDWTDPLMFSPKVVAARGERANPVELAPVVPEGPRAPGGFIGRPVADVNARTCLGAVPVVLTTTPADAYAKLKAAVTGERMAVLTDDPAAGRIEATVARGFWGVRDDLAGRVRPEGAGARVDLRSIARAGETDDGANCDRITRLRKALAG